MNPCVSLLLLVAPVAALAQEVPVQPQAPEEGGPVPDNVRNADMKLGPFYLQPRLGIRDVGWDSNVLGSPDSLPAKQADFRAGPLAGLRFYLPIRGRHVISGDGEVVYQWYKDLDNLRGINSAWEARYEFDSERLQAGVTNRYVNAATNQLERLSLDSGDTVPDSEIFARARYRGNDLRADLQLNLTLRTFVGGRGGRATVRYDDADEFGAALAAEYNRVEDAVGGFIGLQLRPGLKTRLYYDYQRWDYDNPDSVRDATTYRTGVEFDWDTTGRLSGLLRLGYRELTPVQDLAGYRGFIVNANVTTAVAGMVQVQLLGDRDTVPSIWGDNAFFLRQGGGVDLLFQATRRLGLGGRATIYQHEYFEETTFPQVDGTPLTAFRRDTVYRLEGTVSWQIGGREIRLRLGHYDRRSNYDSQITSGLIISSGYVMRF